jgi:hypothetical protein
MTCPWCGSPVPLKTRGSDRRFCSTTCRSRWHGCARKVGETVLTGAADSVHTSLGAELEARGIQLPPVFTMRARGVRP